MAAGSRKQAAPAEEEEEDEGWESEGGRGRIDGGIRGRKVAAGRRGDKLE